MLGTHLLTHRTKQCSLCRMERTQSAINRQQLRLSKVMHGNRIIQQFVDDHFSLLQPSLSPHHQYGGVQVKLFDRHIGLGAIARNQSRPGDNTATALIVKIIATSWLKWMNKSLWIKPRAFSMPTKDIPLYQTPCLHIIDGAGDQIALVKGTRRIQALGLNMLQMESLGAINLQHPIIHDRYMIL